jgi:hypothetical protein
VKDVPKWIVRTPHVVFYKRPANWNVDDEANALSEVPVREIKSLRLLVEAPTMQVAVEEAIRKALANKFITPEDAEELKNGNHDWFVDRVAPP